jgi:hypothetical protein
LRNKRVYMAPNTITSPTLQSTKRTSFTVVKQREHEMAKADEWTPGCLPLHWLQRSEEDQG